MNALSLIIQREYFSRIKKKSFIILTLLMPLLFTALAFVPYFLSTIKDAGIKKIVVIDETGFYASELKSNDEFSFETVKDATVEDYKSELGGELFAILQITDDLSKNSHAVNLLSEKQPPMDLQTQIEWTLSEKVKQQKLDALSQSHSVDEAAIAEVRQIVESGSSISLTTMRWGKDGSISETSTTIATIVGMAFTILIYMFIMVYGGMVMQAVMEEKRSRIVEVMLSSVKPVNLLVGKIIGIGLVGITQLLIWGILIGALFAGATMLYGIPAHTSGMGSMEPSAMMTQAQNIEVSGVLSSILTINWLEIILFFLIFFIGGYIMYASLFATIGASVDNEQDTQQFMMPITILILFAFYAGFYSVNNPDGPLAFWCSLIPFTSPIVMMVRLPFGIPVWQKLLSVVLLYGSFILVAVAAAKIYRVGILMYGKKPTFKEMIKWMRYK